MTERAPTRVGVLGSAHQALVDDRGAITPDGARWQLDWWIGADDRWHVPAREAAVRQALVGGAPVVETTLRVPGGDAVHRAYGVGGPAGLVGVARHVGVTPEAILRAELQALLSPAGN